MKMFHAAASALLLTATVASAQSLLLNFHSTAAADDGPVAAPYLTLDPAHDSGFVPSSDTSWNNFNTAASSSSLSYADGLAATGVTITFGAESSAGSGSIDFTDTTDIRTNVALGTGGGAPGQQSLLGADSIYGVADSSAAARQAWLGQSNIALGLRIDGLAAGEYVIYVMSRNTNSNAEGSQPMNIFATAGANSAAYTFSSLTPTIEQNPTYPNTDPTAYNSFIDGENYVSIAVTIGAGESLFVASDGGSAAELRGFFNTVQVVAVPEPAAMSLAIAGGLGLLALVRRRKTA